MDTSKEYVLMCEAATEIQQLHIEPEDGDYLYNHSRRKTGIYMKVITNAFKMNLDEQVNRTLNEVWLPRQDQLQTLLNVDTNHLDMLHSLTVVMNIYYGQDGIVFDSYEKMWLAFYMHNFYCKYWNAKITQWRQNYEQERAH